MGNMEAQKLDLLNIEQEDDSLLGMSPAKFNVESLLGVSTLLSPSIRLKALKQATSMESCLGESAGIGETVSELACKTTLCGEIVSSLNRDRRVGRDCVGNFRRMSNLQ